MNIVQTIQHKNHTIEISIDEYPLNPREEFDHLFSICIPKQNRYLSGELTDIPADSLSFPLYAYIHSGIALSLSPFSCPWDSGQIGFVTVSKSKALSEFSRKKFSAKLLSKLLSIAKSEISEYNSYLSGEVYCYTVKDVSGNVTDSCCGFYGDIDYCIEAAKETL